MNPAHLESEESTPGREPKPLHCDGFPSFPMYSAMPAYPAMTSFEHMQNNMCLPQDFSFGIYPHMFQPGFCTPSTSRQQPDIISPPSGESSFDSGLGSSDECTPPRTNLKMRTNDDSREFGHVQGRLNLAGSHTFKVTVGELKRRLNGPESMNSSTIASYLRKAKMKEGGSDMRKEIEKCGLKLPTNRRKGQIQTSFSALLEEEALKLGKDFDAIVRSSYPFMSLATVLKNEVPPESMQEFYRELEATYNFMRRLGVIFEKIQTPHSNNENPVRDTANPEFQEGMENMSLLSHGFAMWNQKTWANAFEQVAHTTMGIILEERNNALQQVQMPNAYPFVPFPVSS